ncbi:serine hydrolase domain-containing protein [Microbispora triticiradicis]|uniref:serine hydrolase domain-containing protein n=1 Tax=Microbispora triticiradicis TaxID=2200763 RepID=UPI001AD7328D|nr:serine hydrolase domain-containing protein [Microbispora triticiradicis]MBO4271553.1 serine hydrolase [Microbispora triticiradicis]
MSYFVKAGSSVLEEILRAAVPEVASAAVAVIALDGRTAAASAVGEAVRYAAPSGEPLPELNSGLAPGRPPVAMDALFDIASLTKMFTAAVLVSLAQEGALGLDEPVAAWLPRFYGHRSEITVRHLLTHSAGLPASRRVEREPEEARWDLVLSTPAQGPPGTHLYSDVGMITAGRVAEAAGGAPLDVLVRERVTGPLGLGATTYGPVDPGRAVATEFKPERCAAGRVRGCVRGEVHDETAHALGGVTGHAGLFSTAADLVRFGEALRTGGGPVLSPEWTAEMLRDQGVPGAAFRQGLGVRIGDPAIVGPLTGAFGHSGFTGTSLVVDPARRLTVVLLTNNVHPLRGRPGIRDLRHAVAAEALRLAG